MALATAAKENITPADLLARTQHVIDKDREVVRSRLIRNRIELYTGHGSFIDQRIVLVEDQRRRAERVAVSGHYIVIAAGTKPARPPSVEFDEERVPLLAPLTAEERTAAGTEETSQL